MSCLLKLVDTGDSFPSSCLSMLFNSEGGEVLNISMIPVGSCVTDNMFKPYLLKRAYVCKGGKTDLWT